MSRVVLVNPPDDSMAQGAIPAELGRDRMGRYPPLGLLYLAAAGRAAHPEVEFVIIDAIADSLSHEQVAARLGELQPDIVGISAYTFTMVDAIRVARASKAAIPRAPVVLGGFHASIYPEESLRSCDAFDVVVAGEAEERFPGLVARLLDGGAPAGIRGVSYRRADTDLHIDASNPFVADLDAIPAPDRRMVDYRAHRCILGEPRLTTLILSSRGCPFPCEYCYVNIKQYRERGVERVLDEIRDCLALGIEDFFFTDDLFNLRRERVIDFSNRVLAEGLKIRWSFRGRVDQIDDETATRARAAGCTRIHFGVETGDPGILKRIGKKTDLAMVRRSIEVTRSAGIEVSVNFMIGLPGETPVETERTVRFALSLPADYLQAAVFTPYPKTAAYRRALADGLFATDYWRAFALAPVPDFVSPVWPEHYTREELMERLRRFYRRFYMRPRIILKALGRLRDPAAWRQWFGNLVTFLSLLLALRSRRKPATSSSLEKSLPA